MKTLIKEYEIKKLEVIKDTKYYCDRCGEEIKLTWMTSKNKNKILFQNGFYDGYDTYIEGYHAYLCEKCSIIIKALLEQNGIKFEKFSYDF